MWEHHPKRPVRKVAFLWTWWPVGLRLSAHISYSALYPRQQPRFKSDNPLLCIAAIWTNQVGYIILKHGSHECGAASQANQVGYITIIPQLPWCIVNNHALPLLQQKGRDRGGGWVHLKGADSMAVSGFHFRNASIGSGWTTAVLLCINRLRKQSSHAARHPFPVGKPLSQSGRVVASWVLQAC